MKLLTLHKLRKRYSKIKLEDSEFDKLCNCLETFDENQRELIIRLTDYYKIFRFSNYEKYLIMVVRAMLQDLSRIPRRIYVAPLLGKEDIGIPSKSAYLVAGLCKTTAFKNQKFCDQTSFNYSTSSDVCEHLPENFNSRDSFIILVDDYIGSGTTAMSALDYYISEKQLSIEKIKILVFVAQKKGLEKVQAKYDVPIYYNELRNRGISDNFSKSSVSSLIELMNSIENQIGIYDDYKLGFMETEALITLMRTPNNTFPVYWYENKNYKGPFPR